MKIGICLSGHYRNFDYNYESWEKYLFSKYDCDVFLHTWDIIGNRENTGDVHVEENTNIIPYTKDRLKEKYGFTDVVIQQYDEPLQEFKQRSARVREFRNNAGVSINSIDWTVRRITHLYSMWYKAFKCFQLLESYSAGTPGYDLIIKCRPDIRLHESFNLDDIKIDVLNWPWYGRQDGEYSEPHDYYAVGNFDNMKIYNDLYNHMQEMEDVLKIDESVERFLNPHTLLYGYVQHMGLKTNIIYSHFELMRG
jgi:hypothetical protein